MINSPNKQLKNEYYGIKRRFEDITFVYKIYTVMAIISFLFIGYFGIFRLYRLVQTKRALEKQLVEINTSLESNLASFRRLENDVLTSTNLVDNITVFMPATYSIEDYVTQLSDAVSRSGFILRRVSATEAAVSSGGSYVTIAVKADGPGNPVDLVNNIEKLKRISKIISLTYTLNTHSSVQGDGDASIGLEIYKSEAK